MEVISAGGVPVRGQDGSTFGGAGARGEWLRLQGASARARTLAAVGLEEGEVSRSWIRRTRQPVLARRSWLQCFRRKPLWKIATPLGAVYHAGGIFGKQS